MVVRHPGLLRGQGRFSDDISLPGQVYAAMVRSPHPHAGIVAIEGGAARAMPGVLAVFTGASLLCAVAQSQGMLIGARFVQGIGGAMTSAVTFS